MSAITERSETRCCLEEAILESIQESKLHGVGLLPGTTLRRDLGCKY